MNKTMLFATSNENKLQEVRHILDGLYHIEGLNVLDFKGEIPETSDTIKGNAIQKVEFIAQHTDRPVFAEDTGLLIDALKGAPGVLSARYAGESKSSTANMEKVLEELSGIQQRSAHFKTVLAYRDAEGTIFTFSGRIDGEITTHPRGDRGFGYDPIFVPSGYTKTFGELEAALKNKISHRSLAMRKFVEFLQKRSTRL